MINQSYKCKTCGKMLKDYSRTGYCSNCYRDSPELKKINSDNGARYRAFKRKVREEMKTKVKQIVRVKQNLFASELIDYLEPRISRQLPGEEMSNSLGASLVKDVRFFLRLHNWGIIHGSRF